MMWASDFPIREYEVVAWIDRLLHSRIAGAHEGGEGVDSGEDGAEGA
jgi:hypothetical protein